MYYGRLLHPPYTKTPPSMILFSSMASSICDAADIDDCAVLRFPFKDSCDVCDHKPSSF